MIKCGVFLIDKPENLTSFQVVKKIKQITGIKKAGHTGTLDPFATGLLPICLGSATRISQFLLSDNKTYQAKAKFGIKTNTGDSTGTVIKENDKTITFKQLQAIQDNVVNIKEQIPPQFSAIKINGKKAYQFARAHQEIELLPRKITIFEFQFLEFDFPFFSYQVNVSKGTYIRSLTEQIANFLGTIAVTTELRRTKIGNLSIDNATPFEAIKEDNWQNQIISIDKILAHFSIFEFTENETNRFLHGNSITTLAEGEKQVIVKSVNQNILGIAELKAGILHPKIVFNEAE
jgi:tRNA pseudouridine55 synthase